MQKNKETLREKVGDGGIFYVHYVQYDGTEDYRAFHVLGFTSQEGRHYLACEDRWIPLESVRSVEPYRAAA